MTFVIMCALKNRVLPLFVAAAVSLVPYNFQQ